jgi:predicted  nucleic acid-binding Zn-ribbon protein
MSVNFDFNFWTILLFAMNFGLALFVAISNRSKVAEDELKAMKTDLQTDIKNSKESITRRIEQHGERLARIESDIENSIGDDDIKAVHRRVDELSASSNKMEGQLSMIIDSLKEIHKIMLTSGANHGRA